MPVSKEEVMNAMNASRCHGVTWRWPPKSRHSKGGVAVQTGRTEVAMEVRNKVTSKVHMEQEVNKTKKSLKKLTLTLNQVCTCQESTSQSQKGVPPFHRQFRVTPVVEPQSQPWWTVNSP